MEKPMQFSPGSAPLLTVLTNITNVSNGGLDLQPKYQRSFVWSNEFKNKLLYSVIKKYPIGSISIRELNFPNENGAMQEVVDGQQRLKTIYNFVCEDYKISGEITKSIATYICQYLQDNPNDKKLSVLKRKLNNKTGFVLKYSDLPDIIQNYILAYPLATVSISNSSDEQIISDFCKIKRY